MTDDAPKSIAAPDMHADEHAPPHSWVVPALIAFGITTIIGAIGVVFTLQEETNQRILKQLAVLESKQKTTPEQSSELVSLADAVNKIPGELSQQSTHIDALVQSSAATSEQIAKLNERLDKIEKSNKSSPHADTQFLQQFLALKAAVLGGEPFADELEALHRHTEIIDAMKPLDTASEDGIDTQADLRTSLENILDNDQPADKKSTTIAPPHSWMARLNSQFEGMLHITRHVNAARDSHDPYIQLRAHIEAQAAFSILINDVEALPSDAQERFTEWLAAAQLRQKADDILAHIDGMLRNAGNAP